MAVLVIIPDDDLRHLVRDALGGVGTLRASAYDDPAFVLAEQSYISDAILWSSPGLDSRVLIAIERLRRMHCDVRIFVVTPERNGAGKLGYCEAAKVDGYADESAIGEVIREVLGVPVIIERAPTPTKPNSGSSAACH